MLPQKGGARQAQPTAHIVVHRSIGAPLAAHTGLARGVDGIHTAKHSAPSLPRDPRVAGAAHLVRPLGSARAHPARMQAKDRARRGIVCITGLPDIASHLELAWKPADGNDPTRTRKPSTTRGA